MPHCFTDHYGMTISTRQAQAAQRWQEGLDRLLSQNAGPDTKFEEAIALDEGLAMAHGCLAFWSMQRARPADAAGPPAVQPGLQQRWGGPFPVRVFGAAAWQCPVLWRQLGVSGRVRLG